MLPSKKYLLPIFLKTGKIKLFAQVKNSLQNLAFLQNRQVYELFYMLHKICYSKEDSYATLTKTCALKEKVTKSEVTVMNQD